jgi:hypothetical protein
MQDNSSRKKIGLIVGGGLLLLLLFVFLVEIDVLILLFRTINWPDLLGATTVLLIGYLLLTVRLRYILFNRPGWWETFYANSIGYMLHIALFAPAMISRTASVGWVTSITVAQASSGILIERLLEQVMRVSAGVLVAAIVAKMQTNTDVAVGGGGFLLLVMFGAIFVAMRHPEQIVNSVAPRLGRVRYFNEAQVRSTATTMLQGLQAINSAGRLIVSLLLSYAAWTSFFIFQYLVLTALPLDLPADQMLLIAAVVLTVMPPSINVMLIVYQVVVTVLLVTFQLTDTTTALTYAITLHLIQMICWIVLGSWSVRQANLSLSQLVQAVRNYASKSQPSPEEGDA